MTIEKTSKNKSIETKPLELGKTEAKKTTAKVSNQDKKIQSTAKKALKELTFPQKVKNFFKNFFISVISIPGKVYSCFANCFSRQKANTSSDLKDHQFIKNSPDDQTTPMAKNQPEQLNIDHPKQQPTVAEESLNKDKPAQVSPAAPPKQEPPARIEKPKENKDKDNVPKPNDHIKVDGLKDNTPTSVTPSIPTTARKTNNHLVNVYLRHWTKLLEDVNLAIFANPLADIQDATNLRSLKTFIEGMKKELDSGLDQFSIEDPELIKSIESLKRQTENLSKSYSRYTTENESIINKFQAPPKKVGKRGKRPAVNAVLPTQVFTYPDVNKIGAIIQVRKQISTLEFPVLFKNKGNNCWFHSVLNFLNVFNVFNLIDKKAEKLSEMKIKYTEEKAKYKESLVSYQNDLKAYQEANKDYVAYIKDLADYKKDKAVSEKLWDQYDKGIAQPQTGAKKRRKNRKSANTLIAPVVKRPEEFVAPTEVKQVGTPPRIPYKPVNQAKFLQALLDYKNAYASGDQNKIRKTSDDLYDRIAKFSKNSLGISGRQEDASEFLLLLLNFLEAPGITIKETLQGFPGGEAENVKREPTLEKQQNLFLHIPKDAEPKDVFSIETLIEDVFTPETVEMDLLGKGKDVLALKTPTIQSLPESMVVSAVRFNNQLEKVPNTIRFSSEVVNFGKAFGSDQNKNSNYDYQLAGVVIQIGSSIKGGHYYAVVNAGEKWYVTNDISSEVKEISTQEALKEASQGYIYYFKKVKKDVPTVAA